MKLYGILLTLLLCISCTDLDVAKMSYTETQCADPWTVNSDDLDAYKDAVIQYLRIRHNVDVLATRIQVIDFETVCRACTCPKLESRRISVDISESHREVLLQLGFVIEE